MGSGIYSHYRNIKHVYTTFFSRHIGRDYDTEIKDDSVAPRFLLPLVDQSRKIGESVEFSITGQTGL